MVLATPTAAPTPPQLSKEYVYAGSRLLTVEDAKASAIPPTDLAIWKPSTGAWHVFSGDHQLGDPVIILGESGDIPVQGDYDGDGKTDFAVFRPSNGYTYIVRSSDNSDYSVQGGTADDVPVPADFDGDNKTDIVFRKNSDKKWTIKLSTTNGVIESTYGSSGSDVPIAGDFDGDGLADKAYWKSSNHTFYFIGSSDNTEHTQSLGVSSDVPICADYDGDGKTDFAVKREERWIIRSSFDGTETGIEWQNAGDTPIPNDYDGDGKVDIAVWHEAPDDGMWYIRQSSDLSTRIEKFGSPGDIPVPANYRR
ncbi:MAG: FG-GAP repeat domain-containing protein [Pyrinomonadaceae bacterium]